MKKTGIYILLFLLIYFPKQLYSQKFPPREQVLEYISNKIPDSIKSEFLNYQRDYTINKNFINKNTTECLVVNHLNIGDFNQLFLTVWHLDDTIWSVYPWYDDMHTDLKIIDFEGDGIYELILEKSSVKGLRTDTKTSIVSIKSQVSKIYFEYPEFKYKSYLPDSVHFEEGEFIGENHIIKFKDLDNDGDLDIKETIVKKYYDPKKCSCDSGITSDTKKNTYYFINGKFQIN